MFGHYLTYSQIDFLRKVWKNYIYTYIYIRSFKRRNRCLVLFKNIWIINLFVLNTLAYSALHCLFRWRRTIIYHSVFIISSYETPNRGFSRMKWVLAAGWRYNVRVPSYRNCVCPIASAIKAADVTILLSRLRPKTIFTKLIRPFFDKNARDVTENENMTSYRNNMICFTPTCLFNSV